MSAVQPSFGAAKVTMRWRITNPWDNKTAPDSAKVVAFAEKLLARPEVKRAIAAADKRVEVKVFEGNRPFIRVERADNPVTQKDWTKGLWPIFQQVIKAPDYFLAVYAKGLAADIHQAMADLLKADKAAVVKRK